MKRKIIIICLLLLIISPVAEGARKRVVMVLWHGLKWDDLQTWEYTQPVAYGLLNTRPGGASTAPGAYLSLSAGARAVGHVKTAEFNDDRKSHELYGLHTGLKPSQIVQPDISLIQKAQNVNYTVIPGALGTAILDGGRSIRVLGNSDGVELARWAAVVGTESSGRVHKGNIGVDLLLTNSEYPFGLKTDYDFLLELILEAEEDFIVVDLGDPYRFDQYERFFLQDQKERVYNRMIGEIQTFIEDLIEGEKERSVVMIVSPYPSRDSVNRGRWLTPIIYVGMGEGLLTSGTTRWPGLITNMDVAPSVVGILEVEHTQPFIGRTVEVLPEKNAKLKLTKMLDKILVISGKRSIVLRSVIICQIILYAIVLLSIILRKSFYLWEFRSLSTFLELFLLFPLTLLFWPDFKWLVVGLYLLTVVSMFFLTPLFRVGLLAFVTSSVLIIDVFTGSWLMRYSYLGYDPVGGARFYGLGNEYMGILIGASIIYWAIIMEKVKLHKKWKMVFSFLFGGFIITAVGAPSLGTNVGGAIAAVFAFGTICLLLSGKKITWKSLLVLVMVMASTLGVLMIIDNRNPEAEQSHIGRTVALFRREGFTALQMIIVRKLSMNLRLMRHSIWSKALIVALVSMGASFIWPSKFIIWMKQTYPFVAKGLVAVVVGSLAALVFNDSGVVAAATCLYFGSTILLLLALDLKHNADSS
ncbi:MAG TPA: hypothetical protein GXZ55_03940 [Natronincola sp.]|nr:hypothetical protein [Natronincola sp.]